MTPPDRTTFSAVAFLETKQQLDALRAQVSDWRILTLVAVTPEADYILEREGLAHRIVEEFSPDGALVADGDANIDRLETLADCFDAALHEAARSIPRAEWVSLRAVFHPMKGFLDALTNRALPLAAAFEALRPSIVVGFNRPPYQVFGLELLDKPVWSLTTALTPQVAAANNVRLISVADPTPPPAQHDYTPPYAQPQAVLPAERSRPGAPLLVHNLENALDGDFFKYWGEVLGGGQCGLHEIYAAAQPQAYATAADAAVQAALEQTLNHPAIKPLFVKAGVDLSGLVGGYLRLQVTNVVRNMLTIAPFLEEGLRRLGTPIAIASGGMAGRNYLLGAAATAVGAPFVTFHYGGFLGYSLLPMHERYDLANADFFLVGGPGSYETFKRPSDLARWRPATKRAQPVATGTPWVYKTMREMRAATAVSSPSPQRRLMYVMSSIPGDNRYIGYVYPPDIAFWRFQRRLVERVLAHPDVRLVLKPPLAHRYPQLSSPVFDWLEENVSSSCYDVVGETPLEQAMDQADAFLFDSPSTPLLYLAASNKPFGLFIDRHVYRLVPRARELLRRRAVFLSETEESFFNDLDAFLSCGDWSAGTPDDGFLEEFALGDGVPAERAARFIWNAALGEDQPPTV